MGSRLCDQGGVMSRRSGRAELPHPVPHPRTSLRRSSHSGPHVLSGVRSAPPGGERPSTGSAPRGAAARATASRSFALPPGGLEAEEVPGDPVVRVVALQLRTELLVLDLDRLVQILTAPIRQRTKRALKSAL